MQTIIANIVSDFSALTGITCDVRPDGTIVVPAGDVTKLAALARIAATTSRSVSGELLGKIRAHHPDMLTQHGIPTTTTTGRAGVDWAAAGRKSWETRRRNAKSRA